MVHRSRKIEVQRKGACVMTNKRAQTQKDCRRHNQFLPVQENIDTDTRLVQRRGNHKQQIHRHIRERREESFTTRRTSGTQAQHKEPRSELADPCSLSRLFLRRGIQHATSFAIVQLTLALLAATHGLGARGTACVIVRPAGFDAIGANALVHGKWNSERERMELGEAGPT